MSFSNANAFDVQQNIGHPRLLYTQDSANYVRDHLSDADYIYRDSIIDKINWANVRLDNGYTTPYYCKTYIWLHLITKGTPYWRPEYASIPIATALQQVANNQELSGEGTAWGRMSLPVIVYDWAYDELTDQQRSIFQDAFINRNYGFPLNYDKLWIFTENENKFWHYFACFVGDRQTYVNGTISNNQIVSELERYKDRVQNDYMPCLDEISPNGAVDGYGGIRIQSMILVGDWYKKYSDWNPFESSSHFANMHNFWSARFRSDGEWSKTPAKYNTSDMGTHFFAFYAMLGVPEAENLFSKALAIGWFDPLWDAAYLPTGKVSNSNQYDTNYYDPGMGFFLGRENWDLGTDKENIHVGFFCGPNTQSHRTQNHFFLGNGRQMLFAGSNIRFSDLDPAYWWYRSGIAHNVPLIKTVGSKGDPYDFFNCQGTEFTYPYFGDQLDGDENLGQIMYPNCDGCYGYRGKMLFYNVNDIGSGVQAISLAGDATEAYKDRMSEYIRYFTWIKPNILLLQDVFIPKNEAEISVLYHVVNKPTFMNGSMSQVLGSQFGGVYDYSNTTSIKVTNEDKVAYFNLTSPQLVRLIGGQNSNAENWKEDHDPNGNCTNCGSNHDAYDSNISYEFYVEEDGNNYVPMPCPNPPKIYDVEDRNGSSHSSWQYAAPACDWRFQVEKTTDQPFVLNQIIYVPEQDNGNIEITQPAPNKFEIRKDGENLLSTLTGRDYKIEFNPNGGIALVDTTSNPPDSPPDSPPANTVGACLNPNTLQCMITTYDDCMLFNSLWFGEGTSCTDLLTLLPKSPECPECPNCPNCPPETPAESDTLIIRLESSIPIKIEK